MMTRQTLLLFFMLIIFWSCNSGSGEGIKTKSIDFDPNSYVLSDVPNSAVKKASRMKEEGVVLEDGFLEGDTRQGLWVTYHEDKGIPAKMISFVDGMYNGKYIEMSERGQMTLMATYENNQLHGPWMTYSNFGRPVKQAIYKNGKLDGMYTEYHPTKNNVLQKEIMYKDGEYDGTYKLYNENGELVVEYEYKNGKKISGGIVK